MERGRAPYGFGAVPDVWLPQPGDWGAVTVERQRVDAGSPLNLYREAIRIRRDLPALGDGELTWSDDAGSDVLAFTREPGFTFAANLGGGAVPLPLGEVMLGSGLLPEGTLPADTAVWMLGRS